MRREKVDIRIRQIASKLTYRKVPFLLLYEVLLVSGMWFSPNPYRKLDITSNSWFFGVGFIFLAFLAILEKRKGLPLPIVQPISKSYYLLTTLTALFGSLFIAKLFALLVVSGRLSFQLSPFEPSNWFTIAWNFQFGVVEESFKVGLTNVFGIPTLRMRCSEARNVWICFAGATSVVIWVYWHFLTHAYTTTYEFVTACSIGLFWFAIILWKKNYLPAVLSHGIFDVAHALGYL